VEQGAATPTSLVAALWPCAATVCALLQCKRRQPHDPERHIGRGAKRPIDSAFARSLLLFVRFRLLVRGTT